MFGLFGIDVGPVLTCSLEDFRPMLLSIPRPSMSPFLQDLRLIFDLFVSCFEPHVGFTSEAEKLETDLP